MGSNATSSVAVVSATGSSTAGSSAFSSTAGSSTAGSSAFSSTAGSSTAGSSAFSSATGSSSFCSGSEGRTGCSSSFLNTNNATAPITPRAITHTSAISHQSPTGAGIGRIPKIAYNEKPVVSKVILPLAMVASINSTLPSSKICITT